MADVGGDSNTYIISGSSVLVELFEKGNSLAACMSETFGKVVFINTGVPATPAVEWGQEICFASYEGDAQECLLQGDACHVDYVKLTNAQCRYIQYLLQNLEGADSLIKLTELPVIVDMVGDVLDIQIPRVD